MTTETLKPSIWAFANPTRFMGFANKAIPVLATITLGLLAIGLWMSFNAPEDYQQGHTVLIMFIHVPAAWLAMMSYSVMCFSAIGTIVWRHPLADVSLRSAAPLGAMFTILALATGSLWGKPMWGTWWEWDGRLTSMLVLAFLYAAYIALAQAAQREGLSPRIPALFGLLGAINIPIINRSVVWWNSLHQPPSITVGKSAIDAEFLIPLLVAVIGFSLLFGGVVLARMRALLADIQAEARLRRRAMEAV